MEKVRVVFLGTGDAFSGRGRLAASCLVRTPETSFLLDCGPSILASLKRDRIPSGPIDAVFLSHLHGDHYAGLPFLCLEYTHVEPRARPLLIAGPPGTQDKVISLLELMYPGSRESLPFELNFVEMQPKERKEIGPIVIHPFQVPHQQQELSLGLIVEIGGRKIVYSGDTGWTEDLIARSQHADLLICECSFYETRIPTHMDYPRLRENRARFGAKRIILTHLGQEVLEHLAEIDMELASDGLTVEI